VYLSLSGGLVPMTDLTVASGSFAARVMAVNISLVLFNLIPAFPMDGGRVLRALLAMRMDYVRATQIAANIGQGLAFIFGLIGLFNNPFLLFIAFFVWIGASQEASMVQMRNSISGIPITQAMQTKFETLSPSDHLDRVVNLILAGSQQDFPVVQDGQFIGVLTRDDFIKALSQQGQNTPVVDVIRRNIPSVDSHEMVETALMRLQESSAKTLPVMHGGRFVGLVTSENITEFLMIRSALKTAGVTSNPIV
jgi:predicted transcriptional regulator